ncbi:MAG: methyltransferase domain-containing protein [Actinomycetes bacterium]
MSDLPETGRYVLATGDLGAARLQLLAELYGPATESLLSTVLTPDAWVADIGCGIGSVTHWVAHQLTSDGLAVGVDRSQAQIAAANTEFRHRGLPKPRFVVGDVYRLPFESDSFDLVCCRSLLSHLSDPQAAVNEMTRLVRPGGVLVCEDIDMATLYTDPPSQVYEHINDLFFELGRTYDADYSVGSRLTELLSAAGLPEPQQQTTQPAFRTGEAKRYWEYTFLETVPAMLRAGVTTVTEVAALAAVLEPLSADDTILVAAPAYTHAWARKPE